MRQSEASLQFDSQKRLRHLLSFEDFERETVLALFEKAKSYLHTPLDPALRSSLNQKSVALVFFEPSTRTRASFELAAQNLGIKTLVLNMNYSSTSKGESFYDSIANLNAMGIELLIIRHPHSGAAHFAAKHFGQHLHIINAGDGRHAHPSQALLDAFTLFLHKPKLEDLRIAIVGDILHSRVARSQISLLSLLGISELRLIGPRSLIPDNFKTLGNSKVPLSIHRDLKTGLNNIDAILLLRLQKERMEQGLLGSLDSYNAEFGLNEHNINYAKKDAVIMHPGPINRGLEISSILADSPQALILAQVRYGVAIRMAILDTLLRSEGSHASTA
jgi:aspartate carbamoyltransferase catalytic subunit